MLQQELQIMLSVTFELKYTFWAVNFDLGQHDGLQDAPAAEWQPLRMSPATCSAAIGSRLHACMYAWMDGWMGLF